MQMACSLTPNSSETVSFSESCDSKSTLYLNRDEATEISDLFVLDSEPFLDTGSRTNTVQ